MLQSLAAHLTAWIDYPEEDVPELAPAELRATLQQQKAKLDGWGGQLQRGRGCCATGWTVCCWAGPTWARARS